MTWDGTDPPILSTATPKRHRHAWRTVGIDCGWSHQLTAPHGPICQEVVVCAVCGQPKDPARSRRARNNRARGNRLNATAAKAAGITNIGPLGLPEDAGTSTEWLVIQTKSGSTFPRRIDRLLRALTVTAAQLRGVVHVETPGPGHRAKRLITLDYDEFLLWFGGRR